MDKYSELPNNMSADDKKHYLIRQRDDWYNTYLRLVKEKSPDAVRAKECWENICKQLSKIEA